MRIALLTFTFWSALGVWSAAQSGAAPVIPPPMSAAQQSQIASLPREEQVYELFRYWRSFQPANLQTEPLIAYDKALASQAVPPAERADRLRILQSMGKRLEVERWNRVLTSDAPSFNTEPNAFLVDTVQHLRAGRALDIGMGQGRNALYLAAQGWDVTGFDPAERAVAAAQAEAKRRNLRLTTMVVGAEDFEWGRNRWDLIVASYVAIRPFTDAIVEALAPGGLLVLEGSHRDATRGQSIGGGVVYDSNELLHLFDRLRVLRYEDQSSQADFGPRGLTTRVVRIAAEKPSPPK